MTSFTKKSKIMFSMFSVSRLLSYPRDGMGMGLLVIELERLPVGDVKSSGVAVGRDVGVLCSVVLDSDECLVEDGGMP